MPYYRALASSSSTFTLLLGGAVIVALAAGVGYYEYRSVQRDWRLAERGVQSYAWVTRVSPLWSSTGRNRLEDKCELEAALPAQTEREQPELGKSGALLNAATYFTSVEPDNERACRGYLHTWQRVLFDPQNRAQARFAFGYRSPLQVLFERALLALLLGTVYGGFRLFKRWRRHQQARTARPKAS